MKRSTTETSPDPEADVDPPRFAAATAEAQRGPRNEAAALQRAFVVQLAADCEPTSGRLSGRVQHLNTADGGNFDSTEGLVAIVRRIFERIARTQAQD